MVSSQHVCARLSAPRPRLSPSPPPAAAATRPSRSAAPPSSPSSPTNQWRRDATQREMTRRPVEEMEEVVVIVGAGQSGLATGACLATHGITYTILERDDCVGSLWRKRSYDRVHLHLAKQYCALPHAPHPASAPTFIPKPHFIRYLDDYATRFGLAPRFGRDVESARFDEGAGRWRITARNAARFLVVASGENDEAVVPEIPGLESFEGEVEAVEEITGVYRCLPPRPTVEEVDAATAVIRSLSLSP